MTQSEREIEVLPAPETLQGLFKDLQGTDVDELEIVWGDARIHLRREPGQRTPPASGTKAVAATLGNPILAPLTGVFYARPDPHQTPYVAPGFLVELGDVVGLIETMKLFNEVIADVAGEVVALVASDGDLVEVGQPLLYVKAPSTEPPA